MSDLVERLRRAMTATEMEFITREAADEIERLRAEINRLENWIKHDGEPATIERCAKVAHDYGPSPVIDAIEAAIRALKDKP